MIFDRISELESQANELIKQYATLSARFDKLSEQIKDLKTIQDVQDENYCKFKEKVENYLTHLLSALKRASHKINDLKTIQKAQHDNYCELREEIEKLKRGMK